MRFDVSPNPAFSAWEETITFFIDGVLVEAIASATAREIRVRLTKPIEVDGEDYRIGFSPVLICLNEAMLARRKSLVSLGLTELDDCKRMATEIYRLHRTRLAISEKIEKAENEYPKTRKDELDNSTEAVSIAVGNLEKHRRHLRQQLEVQQITLDQFKSSIGKLRRTMRVSKKTLGALESNIETNLDYLIFLMIRNACDQDVSAYLPLKLGVRLEKSN